MSFIRLFFFGLVLLSPMAARGELDLVSTNLTVWEGDTATFEIVNPADGTVYEWFHEDRSVHKSTNAAYVIRGAVPPHSGHYTVVALTSDGATDTAVANLKVQRHTFLYNPDFNDNAEQSLDNAWVLTDGSAYEFHGVGDILSHESQYFLIVSGQDQTNIVYQPVLIRPGLHLFASIYGLITEEGAQGGNEAWAQMTFRDSEGMPIARYRSDYLGSNAPPYTWVLLRLTNMVDLVTGAVLKTADSFPSPVGSTAYTFEIVHRGQATGIPMRFDTARVAIAPEFRLGIVLDRGSPYITVQTIPGATYRIEYSVSLNPAAWRELQTFTATFTGHQFYAGVLGNTSSTLFFRAQKISAPE